MTLNLTLACVVGGGGRPPSRFEAKRRIAWRKKTADCSRRVIAIGGAFLDPRSIFDPVMRGQGSIFGKVDNFSNLHAYLSKTMNRSDLKLPLACSSFNSEQNRELV